MPPARAAESPIAGRVKRRSRGSEDEIESGSKKSRKVAKCKANKHGKKIKSIAQPDMVLTVPAASPDTQSVSVEQPEQEIDTSAAAPLSEDVAKQQEVQQQAHLQLSLHHQQTTAAAPEQSSEQPEVANAIEVLAPSAPPRPAVERYKIPRKQRSTVAAQQQHSNE